VPLTDNRQFVGDSVGVRLPRHSDLKFRPLMSGATPVEEIHRIQIDRIKQLLVETDVSIAELARQAGFRYQEYFARLFRQRTGLTPDQVSPNEPRRGVA
jgi:AraC-like DNA-binding protein